MRNHIGRDRLRQIESLTIEIDQLRTAARTLAAEIERVDGLLQHFMRPRRFGVTREALNVLRLANGPMDIRTITERMMARLGMDATDGKRVEKMREQLRPSLTRYAAAGILRREKGPGLAVLWSVAARPAAE